MRCEPQKLRSTSVPLRGANNLQPREKRLIIVFSTVDTAEQGVCPAECIEVSADDYANGAEVMTRLCRDLNPISATKETRHTIRCTEFFLSLCESVARWDANLKSYAL